MTAAAAGLHSAVATPVATAACAHCGAGTALPVEERFCCIGCAAAFRLIHELGFQQFYARRAAAPAAQPIQPADGPALDVSDPRPLFPLAGFRNARNRQQYDVAPDGRFLMIRDPRPGEAAPVVYAPGWLAELRAALRR